MRIEVKVKPNARTNRVEAQADGSLLVTVNAPPVDGKANEAVLRAVAEHFGVPRSRVELARGASSRKKILEIREVPPSR